MTNKSKAPLNSQGIKELALAGGFDVARVCDARAEWDKGQKLIDFVQNNYHGEMKWFETTLERRTHPLNMWDGAISALMLGVNYAPNYNPLLRNQDANNANISSYAQNNDYHEVIKKRLKALASIIHNHCQCEVKVFVDTAPLMEKPLAERAGIGWQGKHTNLVSREHGNYLFLGSILIATQLEFDAPETNHCGSCHQCIDICPTNAIIAPYYIDARLCISYLTIEYDGAISEELMGKMGNHVYGCDDCIGICPWNKFATNTQDKNFKPREIMDNLALDKFLFDDDSVFRETFRKSPIKRIGINKFTRNIIIAMGNSGNKNYLNSVKSYIKSEDMGINAAAKWAYNKLSQAT